MEEKQQESLSLNARYYPGREELTILYKKLPEYLTFPERHNKRNQIVHETSKLLHTYSERWTHRYVRLWFNNHKYQDFNVNEQSKSSLTGQNLNLFNKIDSNCNKNFLFNSPNSSPGKPNINNSDEQSKPLLINI